MPGMLEVYEEIEPELKVLVEDVLLNRRAGCDGAAGGARRKAEGCGRGCAAEEKKAEEWRSGTVEERLEPRAGEGHRRSTSRRMPRKRA